MECETHSPVNKLFDDKVANELTKKAGIRCINWCIYVNAKV